MPATKKEPVTPYNVWQDETAPGQEFEHADFLKRLKEVHGIDPATTKGTREMLSHIDGDTWFSWSYQWTIGGKKSTQHTCDLRRGSNRRMWAE